MKRLRKEHPCHQPEANVRNETTKVIVLTALAQFTSDCTDSVGTISGLEIFSQSPLNSAISSNDFLGLASGNSAGIPTAMAQTS